MVPKKPKDVTWTDEQWEAIYEDNKNIIVSAGAGSGKTAVLTERVIRKLKDKVHINEMLILTFTKAAAAEMSDRIRKKIKKIPELKPELNLLDSAYITTFDSFALSVVKKYHYLINVNSNIGIIDASIIHIKKKQIMDEIFLKLYEQKNQKFLAMIKSFCTKDDNDIKNHFITISNKLDLLSNKEEYLNTYIPKYFSPQNIEKSITKYEEILKNKINKIKTITEEISYLDNEFSNKITENLTILYEAQTYNDIVERLNIKLPSSPRGSEQEIKDLRKQITEIIKEIQTLAIYRSKEEITETVFLTKDTTEILIDIIKEFSKKVMQYKQENDAYEFNDIAIMAIHILKENQSVREELKNSFNEIMIDEYQDTNDLQEEFISMISDHNVYMVGDIKQSIYRFRNANPYIFKNKYDNYSNSTIDKKIDLNKNFRSRNEVLDNINTIFNLVMDDEIGGANYIESHQMIFGNKAYLNESVHHSNDMEIYTYQYDKESIFNKEEIEAFLIAKDIQKKYQNRIQVFDKDTSQLRPINYSDISIIMDRASSFDLYKKVFSYFKIPITLLKDEKMNDSTDIYVIRNLIKFILKIKTNIIDTEFKYLFVSLLRSFLYNTTDEEIFDYFINNNYKESELYQTCFAISKKTDYLTISNLLDILIEDFDYYNKLITIGNINNNIVKLDKIKDLALSLESLGYTIEDFSAYLEELTTNNYTMEYKVKEESDNSVKLMTIHKSKGLEYPICYFSGLYKSFNISDLKEKFIFDNEYGIIVPYFQEGISQTIYKDLLKDKYLKEEISEKIRLLYVALTRAREKMILLLPKTERSSSLDKQKISNDIKEKYRCIMDIINSVQFSIKEKYQDIELSSLNLTKEYNLIKKTNYQEQIEQTNFQIQVEELNIINKEQRNQNYSKSNNHLITKEEYQKLAIGTKVHEILERIDLKNPNYHFIEESFYQNIIKNFLKSNLLKNIKNAKIYQEYEFIYEQHEIEYHGIIDLMLEYKNHIDIIDYKLKNISDEGYTKQLLGYKKYIETKTNKPINLYLYSLIDAKFTKIEE